MKQTITGSITTKLLILNAVILCIFIGILFVVHNSFVTVEHSLRKVMGEDVSQSIRNAQLTRKLATVFAGTTYAVHDYLKDETLLKNNHAALLQTVTELTASTPEPTLQQELQLFASHLEPFLQQLLQLNQNTKRIQSFQEELAGNLQQLEALLAEKRILLTLEASDTAAIDQLNSSIGRYRESVLRLALEFARIQQDFLQTGMSAEFSDTGSAEAQYPALFDLLADLQTRFQTLTIADPEIAVYGTRLTELTDKFQAALRQFYETRVRCSQDFGGLRTVQERILVKMEELDAGVDQATGKMQVKVTSIIQASERVILLLSTIFFAGLVVVWFSMRTMTQPLVPVAWCAEQLADGDIQVSIQEIRSQDEVGILARAFKKLISYFQEMAYAVTEIAKGNLDLEIAPRSSKDILGRGFQQMIIYLKDMGQFATQVAQGDLRPQIVLRSPADQLGNAFSRMREGLIALIAEIRMGADRIASISRQVLTTSTKNSDALNHIGNAAEVTSSAMREVSSSAEEVRLNTAQLSSSVEQTSASITQMISSIKHVAENSRKLSGFAAETRITMTDIVQSLEKVTKQTEDSRLLAETTSQDATYGQEAVAQMMARMTQISEVTQSITDIVARLESRSTEIGSILDVIEEVAAQTSLLALNAAIIAAQAGVHGRGFAVVAEEIKELAMRVGTSTKKIAAIIKSVQQDSTDAVGALDRGQQEVERGVMIAREASAALQKISQSAQNSSTVAAEIAVLVRSQTTASNRVANSIQDVTNMVSEITGATQEQEKNSTQLFTVVEKMQVLSSQVARATQEQQQSTFHVTEFMEDVITLVNDNMATVKQLAQTAHELADQSDVLKKQVERFVLPKSRAIIER